MVVGRKTIECENTCHLLASTFITHTFALSSPVIAIGPHHLSQTETVFITMKKIRIFILSQSKQNLREMNASEKKDY